MITIKGEIMAGQGSANLLAVTDQMSQEKSKNVHVLIDSVGGDLDEAISIYNYLRNSGKTITTECVNNCASAASILFIAGEKRIAGCPIMIHNPYLEGVTGGSEELKAMASFIKGKETELQSMYANHTKLETKTLADLMKNDTYISPSQAVNLGFATEAKQVAIAKLNKTNILKPKQEEMSKEKETKTVGMYIRELLGIKAKAKEEDKTKKDPIVYNMTLTTDTGSELQIDREEGAPQVGDSASPDGSHPMPDGSVIVVTDGVITEIKEAQNSEGGSDNADATIEEAVQELESIIEDLKEEVATAKAKLADAESKALKPEDAKILNAVRMAGGADKVFAKFQGIYKPKARTSVEDKTKPDPLQARINAIKNKLKEEGGN